jgi:hypothetical protein
MRQYVLLGEDIRNRAFKGINYNYTFGRGARNLIIESSSFVASHEARDRPSFWPWPHSRP